MAINKTRVQWVFETTFRSKIKTKERKKGSKARSEETLYLVFRLFFSRQIRFLFSNDVPLRIDPIKRVSSNRDK